MAPSRSASRLRLRKALHYDVVILAGERVVPRFVEEGVVVLLALLLRVRLHVLVRHLLPVAQAALHDALQQLQLVLSCPILHQQGERQVVINEVGMRTLMARESARRSSPTIGQLLLRDTLAVALKAHHERVVGFGASHAPYFD